MKTKLNYHFSFKNLCPPAMSVLDWEIIARKWKGFTINFLKIVRQKSACRATALQYGSGHVKVF